MFNDVKSSVDEQEQSIKAPSQMLFTVEGSGQWRAQISDQSLKGPKGHQVSGPEPRSHRRGQRHGSTEYTGCFTRWLPIGLSHWNLVGVCLKPYLYYFHRRHLFGVTPLFVYSLGRLKYSILFAQITAERRCVPGNIKRAVM